MENMWNQDMNCRNHYNPEPDVKQITIFGFQWFKNSLKELFADLDMLKEHKWLSAAGIKDKYKVRRLLYV